MLSSRVVGVCLTLGVVACTSVRPVAPANLTSKELPRVVSVTYPDQTVLVLMEPELTADTLKGLRWGTQDSVKVPLDSVKTVDAKVRDNKKTLLLAATVGVLAVSAAYVVLAETGKADNAYDAHCFGDEAIKHPDEFPECGSQ